MCYIHALLFNSQPESIHGALVDRASGLLWSELFTELSDMLETKGNDVIEGKSKTRMVNIWGDVTTTEERKAALQKLREDLDHKEVSGTVFVVSKVNGYIFVVGVNRILKAVSDPLYGIFIDKNNEYNVIFSNNYIQLGNLEIHCCSYVRAYNYLYLKLID